MLEAKRIDLKAMEWKDSLSPFEKQKLFAEKKLSNNLLEDVFMWRILYLGVCTLESMQQKCVDLFNDFVEFNSDFQEIKSSFSIELSDNTVTIIDTKNNNKFVVFKNGLRFFIEFQDNLNEPVILYELKNPNGLISVIREYLVNQQLNELFGIGDLIKFNKLK